MTDKTTILNILETVTDPEIPVLSIADMGILRDVHLHPDHVEVVITPTYTGCPAMNTIEFNILAALQQNGCEHVKVRTVLGPPWTTDWLTEEAKRKLKAYGIAPPAASVAQDALLGADSRIECPQCGSMNTKLISQFGSTACKALFQCRDCQEPFEYFKCH